MAANSVIEQQPLYRVLPAGQDIVFVVSNQTAVANEFKVKFIAQVHVSTTNAINLSSTNDIIGTFKTTPNNAGVGIFDMRNIIESYVKSDNMAADGSSFKTATTSADQRHPIHLIDKYSLNDRAVAYMAIQFKVEYLGATDGSGNQDDNIVRTQAGTAVNSQMFEVFNGYLKYDDNLNIGTGIDAANFGYDISRFENTNGSTGEFLTNAPKTQYANQDDYGTLAYLTQIAKVAGFENGYIDNIKIKLYNSSDVQIGTTIQVDREAATGGYDIYTLDTDQELLFFGCFPANFRNWSTVFQTQLATGNLAYYSVRAYNDATTTGQRYIINVNCPNLKGFESIRLCWLNQWGAWDYYTFIKKSVRSLTTNSTTYNQLSGTWNESKYRMDSFQGGKKAFRVNATEMIRVNTDFVSENENVMFEELMNSPEVYMLDGFQTTTSTQLLNQFVTPVRVTSSSFTRKTIANDKLMQYTFEIEKSKTLRTQSI